MISDPTLRFSNRVENYIKYRPGYPPEIIDLLREHSGLTPDATVADIGSGTGIFSELLLANGNAVFGVEPNPQMREAGERLLACFPRFSSVAGTAEATTLLANSVDLVTAAQAFHWFDRARTRAEFARILRPGGWVVLIWNDRQTESSAFLRDYELLLRTFATDYAEVRHKDLDLALVSEFVGTDAVKRAVLPNRQTFDYEALLGRLLSSSYAPEEGHPSYRPMIERLQEIFRQHQSSGVVTFEYDTQVYCAQLARE